VGEPAFLHRHRHRLSGNARMRRAVQGLDRLGDLEEVLRQERTRGDEAP
jgi:deoxyribodipyrimidine photolyase-related protein